MSDGPVHDLNPHAVAPEGFRAAEVTVSREEKETAIRQIAGITAIIAMSKGPAEAIKSLMLGIEASLVAMRSFTTTPQVLAVVDHVRANFVELDAKVEAFKASRSAAEEAAEATKH